MNTLQKSIEPEKIIPFFTAWSKMEEEGRVLFEKREKSVGTVMRQGVLIYKDLLKQCSTEAESLTPLNNAERLAFIEENLFTYAAFRQLQELFIEMHKKVASRRAMLGRLENNR